MKITKSKVLTGLVASLAAVSVQASPDWAKKGGKVEKCAGVAKAKKNDCGANGHPCAGKAKKDNDPNEWIYTPAGVCDKIPGGKVLKVIDVK